MPQTERFLDPSPEAPIRIDGAQIVSLRETQADAREILLEANIVSVVAHLENQEGDQAGSDLHETLYTARIIGGAPRQLRTMTSIIKLGRQQDNDNRMGIQQSLDILMSQSLYQIALKDSHVLKEPEFIDFCSEYGLFCVETGNFAKALQITQTARDVCDAVTGQISERQITQKRARLYWVAGLAYAGDGQEQNAIDVFLLSGKEYRKNRDIRGLAVTALAIGDALLKDDDVLSQRLARYWYRHVLLNRFFDTQQQDVYDSAKRKLEKANQLVAATQN